MNIIANACAFRGKNHNTRYFGILLMPCNTGCCNVAAVCWSVNGEFVTSPANKAVLMNDRVEFTCTTDDSSPSNVWYFSATGSTDLNLLSLIVNDCNVEQHNQSVYHTEPTATGCNLIINSTRLMDAGIYLCNDPPDYAAAELVVLGIHFVMLISEF